MVAPHIYSNKSIPKTTIANNETLPNIALKQLDETAFVILRAHIVLIVNMGYVTFLEMHMTSAGSGTFNGWSSFNPSIDR